MSIIKETIKFNNLDANIKISLGSTDGLTGYQQELDNLTEQTKVELINPVIDNEVRRFQYDSTNAGIANIMFYFTSNNTTYNNTFVSNGARFSPTEISSNDIKILNSFFILDLYDTFDNFTQTKIFRSYVTKISGNYDTNPSNYKKPYYRIYSDTSTQFYNWYVPKSFIDLQSGSTISAYLKFSFFNAKYGDVILFYNKDIETPEKMYFKILLNLNTMTWKFDYSGVNYPPNVKPYQVLLSSQYSQKVNNAVNMFDDKKQTYPTGTSFQYTTGTYTTE